MRLPGFMAEASTTGSGGFYCTRTRYANRPSANTVTMATQCCPPGYDTTGCTPPLPPHCCAMGFHCCGECLHGRCVPDPFSGQGCVRLGVLCQ
jgi:hypothetical protein